MGLTNQDPGCCCGPPNPCPTCTCPLFFCVFGCTAGGIDGIGTCVQATVGVYNTVGMTLLNSVTTSGTSGCGKLMIPPSSGTGLTLKTSAPGYSPTSQSISCPSGSTPGVSAANPLNISLSPDPALGIGCCSSIAPAFAGIITDANGSWNYGSCAGGTLWYFVNNMDVFLGAFCMGTDGSPGCLAVGYTVTCNSPTDTQVTVVRQWRSLTGPPAKYAATFNQTAGGPLCTPGGTNCVGPAAGSCINPGQFDSSTGVFTVAGGCSPTISGSLTPAGGNLMPDPGGAFTFT